METHPLIGTTYIFSKKKLPHHSLRRKPPLQSVNFNTGRRNLNRSQRRKARLPSRSQSSPECLQSCTWSIAAPEGTAVSFAPFKTRYFHSAFSFFQFSFNEHNLFDFSSSSSSSHQTPGRENHGRSDSDGYGIFGSHRGRDVSALER